MASNGKKKTTMAKLNRESKLRERRMLKKAKKDARKNAPPEDPDRLEDPLSEIPVETPGPVAEAALDDVVPVLADA